MSEHDEEAVLRAQLSALVQDRPAALSPAPLVIARVRRSRRRRAAAGALAVALTVTGGALLGVDRGSAPTPAKPSPAPAKPSPSPAQPVPLCRVPLPSAWAKALADPAYALPHGTSLIAATADGSKVFVQDGNRVLELTDHLKAQRTAMTLPAVPAAFPGASWTVSGSFNGTWLVVTLQPDAKQFANYLGLYAWNASTGATRALLAVTPHPTRELSDWVVGPDRVAWQSEPFRLDGGVADGTVTQKLTTLSTGREQALSGVSAFVGNTMLVIGKDQVPYGVSLDTGQPVAIPAQLTAFFPTSDSWASYMGDGSAFAWGKAMTSAKGAGGKETSGGPASWDVWWSGTPSVVQVTAPSGSYVDNVSPLAPNYAVAQFHRDGEPMSSEVGSSAVLVDLRNGSSAPLTAAQKTAMESSGRSMPTTALPRLPHC